MKAYISDIHPFIQYLVNLSIIIIFIIVILGDDLGKFIHERRLDIQFIFIELQSSDLLP